MFLFLFDLIYWNWILGRDQLHLIIVFIMQIHVIHFLNMIRLYLSIMRPIDSGAIYLLYLKNFIGTLSLNEEDFYSKSSKRLKIISSCYDIIQAQNHKYITSKHCEFFYQLSLIDNSIFKIFWVMKYFVMKDLNGYWPLWID